MFHPKVYIFDRNDGSPTILVGSNNLTPGGLSENIEISVRLDDLTNEETEQWNALWRYFQQNSDIKEIDENLLNQVTLRHRSEQYRRRRRRGRRRHVVEVETPPIERQVLVRYIPYAGGRTSQVHFTRHIVEQFFHMQVRQGGSVRLQQVQPNQSPQPIEERNLVYSVRNMNPKIELNGVKSLMGTYVRGGPRPIVILEKIDPSFYRYMLLQPRNRGYRKLARKLDTQPREGQALPSWITDLDSLLEVWGDYPH